MSSQVPNADTQAIRILLTLAGVFAIALWPMAWWRWQLVSAALLTLLTVHLGMSPRTLFRRSALLLAFAAVMALGLIGQPQWHLRAGNLLLKSALSLWTVSLLVYANSMPALLAGLRRLQVPRVWTQSLAFWSRYYAVLTEEWHRLQLARRARTMDRSRRRKFRALSNALGLLFIRAYERAEQVHRAMLARGYRENS